MSETVRVHSADGTHVGFDRTGDGPPRLLVHGSTADSSRWGPVIPALERRFTLLIPDRRGRGQSKEEAPAYSIEREAEDLIAIAESVPGGGAVRVFAHSFGALVTMEAARRSSAFGALVLYEPPFTTPAMPVVDEAAHARNAAPRAADHPQGARVAIFRDVIPLPPEAIDAMRGTPVWKARIAAVHTILREADAVRDWALDPAALAAINGPVRLLLGTATTPALTAASRALDAAMPDWELVELDGQGHQAIDGAPDLVVEKVLEHLG